MTSPTVSAVLFDLDGTLIDTAPEFIHIGLQLRAEAGLPPIDAKTIWHSVSNGAIGMVEAALEMPAEDPAFEERGLRSGGVDFIRKPFSAEVVRARVRLHIELQERTRELKRMQEQWRKQQWREPEPKFPSYA